jgi:hypothetical protein
VPIRYDAADCIQLSPPLYLSVDYSCRYSVDGVAISNCLFIHVVSDV